MSNLSELLPTGGGQNAVDFVASGTLTSGQTVALKADGTVEAVGFSSSSIAENVGTETQFQNGNPEFTSAVFDVASGKVVIAYRDFLNLSYGKAVVGTVSGDTISFGTPVVWLTATANWVTACYDSVAEKVVVFYTTGGTTGYAIVGTVSGTSISFGSAVTYSTQNPAYTGASFDTSAGKTVTAFMAQGNSNYATAIVGTVSGTSISFGSAVVFRSANTQEFACVYDTNADKTVICYRESSVTGAGEGIVGTVSGTSISFGSAVQFDSAPVTVVRGAYDSATNQVICAYTKATTKVVLGTVSGTSISFGAIVSAPTSNSSAYNGVCYDSNVNKIVLTYAYGAASPYSNGTIATGTVSGTTLSFASPVATFNPTTVSEHIAAVYDSTNKKSVIAYGENNASGEALVFQAAGTASTSNSADFIGITDQAIADTATGAVIVQGGVITNSNLFPLAYTGSVGSEVVFEAARADHSMPIFDSSNNKVVIIYADNGDSSHGKAIVGTVSGSSISYGTAVTFNAATTTRISGTFDSNSNKVVIAFGDDGDSSKVKSIVGTVSGTSISFGSEATITTNTTGVSTTTTFDSNSNKVVVFYRDDGNSEYGTAAVGTVSGTSISFGTPVVFESAGTGIVQSSSTFDTSANKTVVAYRDVGNSSNGTAIVGTVSGTSISFGTAVVFHAASTEETLCAFDSVNNKVVVAYRDNAAPKALASRVGTISGTSISFGTEATVQSITSYIGYPAMSYSPDSQRVVIVYTNADNSSYGTYALGSVSGTDITYDTPVVFAAASTEDCGIAYDTNADKFVVSFKDTANSNHGTSVVLTLTGTVPALTIGSDYYVQDDGSLSTATSTVKAGQAISATTINMMDLT